eukprot:Gregarina_sp_Poly_1__361@NODE_1088_length_5132_cov_211_245410_g754_i0_p1_GENE_NODE_1088_length_5132_cov_211_245410_g754_i0NODE_1088_length_5132_cov_211_245410_g754_i0_p1_ORF_typecomplete_len521_score62_17XRN_M/PF17846_1/4_3e66HalX/PF08663_10/3e02HalX/PF08663_10/2_4_NODE_1088_length_5132_cov_211_245410_g754_i013742936
MGGYLTHAGKLNMGPLKYLAGFLAQVEPEVLRFDHQRKVRMKRSREEQERAQVNAKRRRLDSSLDPVERQSVPSAPPSEATSVTSKSRRGSAKSDVSDDSSSVSALSPFPLETSKVIESELTQSHREAVDAFRDKLKSKMTARSEVDDALDDIQLGSGDPTDYRQKYYRLKFHLERSDDVESCAMQVSTHFVRGLEWVLLYYYQGVPTWDWFFPFHYAPLAVDIHRYGLKTKGASFDKIDPGVPFSPLEQLMANLPPRSACFLPPCLAKLMTDPASPLRDFYPKKFHEDPDGKRFRWQWVALVPFIDPVRLKAEARKHYSELSSSEIDRNTQGHDLLFVHADQGRLATLILEMHKSKASSVDRLISTRDFGVTLLLKPPTRTNDLKKGRTVLVDCEGFPEIIQTCVAIPISHPSSKRHRCVQLSGAVAPPRCLTTQDALDQDKIGNRFNAKVAKRMIMQVIGGPHYEAFREKEERERESTRSYNPSHIPNNPSVQNIDFPANHSRGRINPFLTQSSRHAP